MGFDKKESEQLLADCGRRCCICGKLHKVQIHHIKPKEKGVEALLSSFYVGIPIRPGMAEW